MKKCASCSKDLPDAALHCVFCGAKQPPAPAGQQGLARTAFGYSAGHAGEVQEPLRPDSGRRLVEAPPLAKPLAVAAPAPPRDAGPTNGPVPALAANAATLFAPGAQPPPAALAATIVPPQGSPMYGRPLPPTAAALQAPTMIAPQAQAVPVPSPSASAPQIPPTTKLPAAQPPPYLTAQTATRAGRPIEPWSDRLRLLMLLWGIGLLAVFATPLQLAPALVFHWTAILEGDGPARLPPLTLAAVGLLSVVLAGIPMPPAARGLLAAVLGLAGILVPIALAGAPPWHGLALIVGTLVLVPGLLLRSEYRDAALPRVLVTLGALGVLALFVIPRAGAIPLVGLIRTLIDQAGGQKLPAALALGPAVVAVMAMLAWLPGPATGGAKVWVWLVILWGLVTHVAQLVLAGHFVDAVLRAPNLAVVAWIAGGASPVAPALGPAYVVLVGYGLASVLGKQLE